MYNYISKKKIIRNRKSYHRIQTKSQYMLTYILERSRETEFSIADGALISGTAS